MSKKELNKWQKVAACKTMQELSEFLTENCDEKGMIQGTLEEHDAYNMSNHCISIDSILKGLTPLYEFDKRNADISVNALKYYPTKLTRNYGIRAKACEIIIKAI